MEPNRVPISAENGPRRGLPGSHQLQPSDDNNNGLQQPSSHESRFPHDGHQDRSPSESTSSSSAIERQKEKWIARGHIDAAICELSYCLIHAEEGCDVATLAAKLAILMAICVVGELCAKDEALREKLEDLRVPWKLFVTLRNLIFKPTCQQAKISILEGSTDDSRVSLFKSLYIDMLYLFYALSHILYARELPRPDFDLSIAEFSGINQLLDLLQTEDPQAKKKDGFQVGKNERTRCLKLLLNTTKDILQPPHKDDRSCCAELYIQPDKRHCQGVMGILSGSNAKLTQYQKIVRSATTLNMIQIVSLFSTYNFKVHPDSEILRNQASHLRLLITDSQGKHATKKFLTHLFSKEEVFTDFIRLHDWRDSGTQTPDRNAAPEVSVGMEVVSADVDSRKINEEAIAIFKDSVSRPDILGFFRAGKFDPIIKALKADHSSIDINKQDHNGNTLVHLILMRADEFIHGKKFLGVAVTCFKQDGLKLDITNDEELTPICLFKKLSDETKKKLRRIMCEEYIPVSVMRLFLDDSDFDPDEIIDPRSGDRLLHIAAGKGLTELIEYLLFRSPISSDPLVLCKHGMLPPDRAELKQHSPTIKLLEESTRAQLFKTFPMSHLLTADNLPST